MADGTVALPKQACGPKDSLLTSVEDIPSTTTTTLFAPALNQISNYKEQ